MKNQTVFVKVSGDLLNSPAFLKKLEEIGRNVLKLVICVGGGTQINEALTQAGFKVGKHGPLGRELKTTEERQIAKDVLNRNCAELRDYVNATALGADVIIPVLGLGGVICHVNGDLFVKAVYNGFDRLYVFTMKDRVVAKAKEFNHLPKVRIIGL